MMHAHVSLDAVVYVNQTARQQPKIRLAEHCTALAFEDDGWAVKSVTGLF